VNQDPEFRPKITDMFRVLRICHKEFIKAPPSPINLQKQGYMPPKIKKPPQRKFSMDQDEFAIKDEDLPDSESFDYMTLAEAEKQHRLVDRSGAIVGDLKNAYKCFEAYAKFNQVKAKYYKAYYISKGYADFGNNIKEKEKIVADLFKDVADDEANEFPEAKLRYGDCLYNGKGVKQNLEEALKYFEKAAENGLKVA
ncbi:503_t:CDS:1, partial [Funneliformis geosporum]